MTNGHSASSVQTVWQNMVECGGRMLKARTCSAGLVGYCGLGWEAYINAYLIIGQVQTSCMEMPLL